MLKEFLKSLLMQKYKDAGKKLLDLFWVDSDKSVDPAHKKIRSGLCAREYKPKRQGNIQRALFASQLFSAMPPLEAVKALVSIKMSVGSSSESKPLKLRDDTSNTDFHGTAQSLTHVRLPAEDRQKYGEDKGGRLIKSTYGTQDASRMWQFDHANVVCGELGGFRSGKHSAALFHNTTLDVRMAVHRDDFECLSDEDGLNNMEPLFESKYTAKDMGTLGFERFSCEACSVVEPSVQSWNRSYWTTLGR